MDFIEFSFSIQIILAEYFNILVLFLIDHFSSIYGSFQNNGNVKSFS